MDNKINEAERKNSAGKVDRLAANTDFQKAQQKCWKLSQNIKKKKKRRKQDRVAKITEQFDQNLLMPSSQGLPRAIKSVAKLMRKSLSENILSVVSDDKSSFDNSVLHTSVMPEVDISNSGLKLVAKKNDSLKADDNKLDTVDENAALELTTHGTAPNAIDTLENATFWRKCGEVA